MSNDNNKGWINMAVSAVEQVNSTVKYHKENPPKKLEPLSVCPECGRREQSDWDNDRIHLFRE